jgi:hypothetical protein
MHIGCGQKSPKKLGEHCHRMIQKLYRKPGIYIGATLLIFILKNQNLNDVHGHPTMHYAELIYVKVELYCTH